MAEETVQAFLVSLGFKLDETQSRRFDDLLRSNRERASALDATINNVGKQLGILGKQLEALADVPTRKSLEAADRIAKRHEMLAANVKSLGLTAATTTATFVAGFIEIARQYDRLYYISQRTGVSAQALAAQQFAGPQVGLGANDLVAATEALATAARHPGLRALVESWGVAANDLNGIIRHLAALPPFLQDAYAGMLGISTTTLRNLIANYDTMIAAQQDFNRRSAAAGVDYGKTTRDAVDVTRALEQVWSQLGIIAAQGFKEALPAIRGAVAGLEQLLETTAEWNKAHPGAALAENMAAALVSATGLLAILGKMSGLPLLQYGVVGAMLYGAYRGATGGPGTQDYPMDPNRLGAGSEWLDLRYLLRRLFGGSSAGGIPGAAAYAPVPDALQPGGALKHYQLGGFVSTTGPAFMHAGEQVVPGGVLEELLRGFASWWAGNPAYRPFVQVMSQTDLTTVAFHPGEIGGGGGFPPSAGGGGDRVIGPTSPQAYRPAPSRNLETLPSASLQSEAYIRNVIAAAGGNEFAQAALLSNFYAESGLKEGAVEPHGGATGWAQWIGPRLRHLRGYGDPRSREAQARQLYYELTGPYHAALEHMNAQTDATKAAIIGLREFEGITPENSRLASLGHTDWAGMIRTHAGRANEFLSRGRIGGAGTVVHHAGDRTASMNQTNHIYVQGGATEAAAHHVVKALDDRSGVWLRNARTAIF